MAEKTIVQESLMTVITGHRPSFTPIEHFRHALTQCSCGVELNPDDPTAHAEHLSAEILSKYVVAMTTMSPKP